MKFIDVTTEYTGGGIYIFMGKLDNGIYFMCDDMYASFLDADPREAGDDAYYTEWQEKHDVEFDIDYPHFFLQMCDWIKENKPDDFDSEIERLAWLVRKELHTSKIEAGYIPEMDTTVIFRFEYDMGNLYSKEIVGWYQGEPNDEDTELYKDGSLKAVFD